MSKASRFPEARAKAAERYVSLWNVGLAATLEARGHCELQARAMTSYERWVGSEGLSFRARDDAPSLGDVAKFHWEAVAGDGTTAAVGLSVLVLAANGRVQRNDSFVDGA